MSDKDKKVRNIHDRRFSPPVQPAESAAPRSPVSLSQEEAAQIKELHGKLSGIKSVLAEACMNAGVTRFEIERLEKVLGQQNDEIAKIEVEAIQVRVETSKAADAIARAHGIPVEDPKQGRWRIDVEKGILVQEPPV